MCIGRIAQECSVRLAALVPNKRICYMSVSVFLTNLFAVSQAPARGLQDPPPG